MPQLKHVEHNSQNEFYRSPVGAAEATTGIRLRRKLELSELGNVQPSIQIKARFWRERVGEMVYELLPEDPVGGEMYYSANITMPERGCLLWYILLLPWMAEPGTTAITMSAWAGWQFCPIIRHPSPTR